MYNLGVYHLEVTNPKNIKKAIEFFMRAKENGDFLSKNELAKYEFIYLINKD